MDGVKGFCNVQLEEQGGRLGVMQVPYRILSVHEVILNTSFLDEGVLARGNDGIQMRGQTVCQ